MQMESKMFFAVNVKWADGDLSPEESQGSQIEDRLNAIFSDTIDQVQVEKVYLIHPDENFDDYISAGQLHT